MPRGVYQRETQRQETARYDYPWEPDPEYPLLDVFHFLRDAKKERRPFPDAWREACKVALAKVRDKEERKSWSYALHSTYGAWERAYLDAADGDFRMYDLNLFIR